MAPKQASPTKAATLGPNIFVYFQIFKWCPGAESNHRHEDFQSTALPLSYPGTGNGGAVRVEAF